MFPSPHGPDQPSSWPANPLARVAYVSPVKFAPFCDLERYRKIAPQLEVIFVSLSLLSFKFLGLYNNQIFVILNFLSTDPSEIGGNEENSDMYVYMYVYIMILWQYE